MLTDTRWTRAGWLLASLLLAPGAFAAQAYLDNETMYSNQDPETETRRSDHIRVNFGHFNRDTGTPMTEQFAQGNLQEYELMWNRWVNELGLHDINESVTHPDGNKYRANFNFLMTWNDGGGGGAYSSMDGNGFFYAMSNPANCRYDPPSGATPHEFGHVWEGSCGGFNGTDSSGSWWECTANWMLLQFLNSYPQAGGYIWNGMYYPAHGRDYYDTFMIWEAARDDARYGVQWVNNVWTNYNADQQAHEYILDRMIRCDTSGSADKAGAMKDLWGDMAKKMITWDFERQQWLKQANNDETSTDLGQAWYWYQRCRTPLVKMAGATNWFRPSRDHVPMEYGFNFIPLTATPGTTVTCNFQPQCDPVRQSDWRACLVAVNANGDASYSTLWNKGANSITLSTDQTKLYLSVMAVPKPMKIADPVWNAYQTDAGLQFPYAVSFTNATPKNVVFTKPTGITWKNFTNTIDGTICSNIASGATISSTAYVSPNAKVLDSAKVQGYARVEDYAVVRGNAQVRDYAVVSGHAVVQDNAQVYGNAKVRDWARVFGYAEIYEDGKVLEHGNCGDGNATTHSKVYGDAIVKGTTYVYDTTTINGCLIMDGDSANGNGTTPTSTGVHFGWGWGADTARFAALTNNYYMLTRHTFDKDNAVFALDAYGINHGLLMNGCRPEISTDGVRGGRVLPLNGINQYVELHNTVGDFREVTYTIWVKWAGSSSDQYIWSMGDGTNEVMYLTPQDSATGTARFVISNGTTTQALDTGAPLPLNTWTHLAVSFGTPVFNTTTRTWSATGTLYLNGTPVASQSGMLVPDSLTAPLMENANYLGRGNAGNYFQGSLDDFRVYMKTLSAAEVAAVDSEPAPAAITITADTTAPTPNAATWLVAPTMIRDDAVSMSATPGIDASGWVEYYFTCTAGGGHDSGWVSFNKYTDCGLTPGGSYTYTVKMRDRNGNTTATSAPGTATPQTSALPAASFSYGPVGIANGQITMSATKVTNLTSIVEYKFDRVSPSATTSGWQSSPNYTQTGLTTGGTYSYTVTVRDGRGNVSAPSAAANAVARDDAAPRLVIPIAHWQMMPYATISNTVCMTANAPSDASGVQYMFECVSGGGPNSAWQSSATYTTPVLPDGNYVYRYKTRDTSAQNNVSGYSTSYTASIRPTTGYHTYTLSQVVTNQDDYLVSFPATVMRVNTRDYSVKDLTSGAAITVEPATSNLVTDASLALKNVTVKGHLYTRAGTRVVTWSTVTSTGNPTLNTISGKVTNTLGAAISGATVYFNDGPNASSNAVATTTTDASGNYSKGVPAGTWYVAAGAAAYNTSTDRVVTVSGANVTGVNFGLVANAKISGRVTNRDTGVAVAGALVYFSRSPGASAAPVFTATADANGNYLQAVQDGVWYVAAGGTGLYTSYDKVVTVAGVDVPGIDFVVKTSTRNIPRTADLWFSAVTESLPGSGLSGNWPTYLPAGQTLTASGSPMMEILNGAKWVKTVYGDGDGFRQARYDTAVAINGATIGVAVKPLRNSTGTSWTSVVDIFYQRLVLGVRNSTGQVEVWRNGVHDLSSTAIPSGQTTILTLVVQPTGQYKVYANGTVILNVTSTADMTSLNPDFTATWGSNPDYTHYVDVGRNDPDGWTVFNGDIGDVFVYKVALADTERQQLEADLTSKFMSTDYTIAVTANSGGYVNPGSTIYVAPGATQVLNITPLAGYRVADVKVDNVSKGATNSWTFANMAANHTLNVTFGAIPTFTTTKTDVTCNNGNNGSIVVTAAGGSGSGYSFSKNNGTNFTAGASPYTFNNLPAGSYNIVIKDGLGVVSATNTVVINQPAVPLVADAGTNATVLAGNSVTIGGYPTASGGTPGYTYAWSPTAGLSSATVANPVASPTTNTTYSVVVTDSLGCTAASFPVTVTVTPTTPPTLAIAVNAEGKLDITWPAGSTNQLLTSGSFGPNASWSPLGIPPTAVNGTNKVTITPTTNAFYMLGQ